MRQQHDLEVQSAALAGAGGYDGARSTTALPPTDVDSFLYHATAQVYLAASQSNDDTSEGIELAIFQGYGGQMKLYLSWRAGGKACGGSTTIVPSLHGIHIR